MNCLQFDNNRGANTSLRWPEVWCDKRYGHQGNDGSLEKHDWSQHLLNRPNSLDKKDKRDFGKAFTTGYAPINWVHSSRPLLTARGNIGEMLKEHEK
ncbi:hypothetical protein Nepgr_021205 [Nepenthes gracilis]|uniref:Uncharacterized protein n=1 Tax=Nepenthes gracilis TaxID=150966 RepID=A0AAD3XWU0_NEPGR|nr:hypothetical protein Nepgr_021205 [Nepenthes gracilis]